MGGLLSVTLANTCKSGSETVAPVRAVFYNWYVDAIFNCRQKKLNLDEFMMS